MNNWLKAIFINTFLIGAFAAAIHSWIRFVGDIAAEASFAWLAAALANTLVCSVFVVYIGRGKRARTSANLPVVGTAVFICALVTLYYRQQAPLAAFYGSGLAGAGLLAYLFWYSKLPGRGGVLHAGASLPEFSLQLADGSVLSSRDISGPSLIIFYRGNWCPLCVAQVKEVVDQYHKLEAMGVTAYMVSPQPQEQTVSLAKRFSAPINFCVDANNDAARVLGIEHKRGLPLGMEAGGYDADTVMPTVIILDQEQKIAYLDETDNYRVRPEPEIYLDIFQKMGLSAS